MCASYCRQVQEGFRHCSGFLRPILSVGFAQNWQYLVDNSTFGPKYRGFWLTHALWAKILGRAKNQ